MGERTPGASRRFAVAEHRTIAVKAEGLTVEAWGPFGQIPVDETDPVDPVHMEFKLADPHCNFIFHSYDEVARTAAGRMVCDHLNRHDTATQTLMPMNCDAVLVVAPASVDFSSPEHLESVRAFVLRRHEICNLAIGTWHWGPFPIGPGHVRLLNVQGKGFPNDNLVARLDDGPGPLVEVVT
jgi:ureidoglycolate hydrolase